MGFAIIILYQVSSFLGRDVSGMKIFTTRHMIKDFFSTISAKYPYLTF
jgi:hypothetical protein